MIDPTDVLNYNRTTEELQEFFIFCVCVAGHNAVTTAKSVDKFLAPARVLNKLPMDYVAWLLESGPDVLIDQLRRAGIGFGKKISRCFLQALESKLDVHTCTLAQLEALYGVGPKTARYFLLYTRPEYSQVAVLDRHVMRFLQKRGHNIPETTPAGKKYLELEQHFIRYAAEAGRTVAEFDLDLWKQGSRAKEQHE